MSVYQEPSRVGKWFCDRCKTWCMNDVKKCSLCSHPRPKEDPNNKKK